MMSHSIPSDCVDLWYAQTAKIDDPQLLDAYRALMTPAEVEQSQRFVFDRHRQQYLVTRALVRTTLSQYADVEPQDWRFQPDRYGKPHVAGPVQLPLAFNLSHTEGLVICGVAPVPVLGVDVERLDRRTEGLAIADRFFSAPECEYLASQPEEERRAIFFQIWTLKEAYIKARGEGLSIPLADFAFRFSADAPVAIDFLKLLDDTPQRWQFFQLQSAPYRLAVAACDGAPLQLSIRETIPLKEAADPQCPSFQRGLAEITL